MLIPRSINVEFMIEKKKKKGNGANFIPVLQVHLPMLIQQNGRFLFSLNRGLYNGPFTTKVPRDGVISYLKNKIPFNEIRI
jgi:hypothetical protein